MGLIPRQERGIFKHQSQVFGKSVRGAPLEVFLPKSEARCLVLAGQHGSEPEGTVLLSSVLRSIRSTDLIHAVVPGLNPDGLARGTRANANGVDLNRNFPTSNWTDKSTHFCWNDENPKDTRLSPGKKAASEPETRALLELILTLNISKAIGIHAPLGCIDDPEMSDLGHLFAQRMNLPLVDNIGYPTPGSFGTWCKEHNLHLITIELPINTIQNHRRNYTSLLGELLTGQLDSYL